jgi:hypothetical protein
MGYCHDSGERRSPKDGVVLRRPVDNFELDFLLLEVRMGALDDVQVDHSQWIDRPPWDDAMEGVSEGRRSTSGMLIFRKVLE